MKKILCVLLAIMLVLTLAFTANATTEIEEPTQGQASPSAEGELAANDGEKPADSADVDYVLLARQFAAYIQSGEAPEELIDSFIAMGEEMRQMKEDGYTLKERLLQLIAPENLLTTCTALFMVAGAIILLVLKRKQKDNELDIGDILDAVGAIKKKQNSDAESADERSTTSQQAQSEILNRLKKMEKTLASMKLGSEGAAAVAKMVKDVFLNSRTLDADGKQLMIRNYNEAIGLLDGDKDEKSNETTAE